MVKPNSELRPRLRTIAQSLLAKTRAGQANWTRAPGDDLRYELRLPESRIVLAYLSPRVEPDYLSLQLHTLSGVAVGALEADEPEPGEPLNPPDDWATERAEHEADWMVLQPLFDEVHRSVTGWDKVMKDVETALARPGAIGVSANREVLPARQ